MSVYCAVLCIVFVRLCESHAYIWMLIYALAETRNVWVPSSIFIFLNWFLASFVYMCLFLEYVHVRLCVHVYAKVCMCMCECLAQQSDRQRRTCGNWLFPRNQTQIIRIGKRKRYYIITYFLASLFLSCFLSLFFFSSSFLISFLPFFFLSFLFFLFDKGHLTELGSVLIICHHA